MWCAVCFSLVCSVRCIEVFPYVVHLILWRRVFSFLSLSNDRRRVSEFSRDQVSGKKATPTLPRAAVPVPYDEGSLLLKAALVLKAKVQVM